VKEYAQVFWDRYTEISNYEKHIKAIEKGEGNRQRLEEMKKHLDKKMARYYSSPSFLLSSLFSKHCVKQIQGTNDTIEDSVHGWGKGKDLY
jgi:hypothetical protein